ncbi:mannose 6-phosphate receptor domain-containing protein [Hortaea werneckii]|nr:mannose 6-phosphate receptor domain-containing protein [Hortaea werneckii]KAI6991950.1 mannose 6-phosphate receptor domain-containing protein [Hortaea werneckii]KAI7040710.1 mannose 6-phosphate receptor domain-containing protein [Hortaea werneckii]KAI7055506.1 mannose 6-phosphate receptor domain-containing protein [Hortaea werneckii]KAI7132146.1 mannose 6-phosphate receptor domain-containing protein [Hortaea werneckii]
MRLLYYSLTLYLSTLPATPVLATPSPVADAVPAARETSAAPQQPCTVRSPNTGAFFDLNPLHIEDPARSKAKHPRDYSWNTTGWGLPYNFTMNFCGPVVEDLEGGGGVEGVDKRDWGNVSAFYRQGGKTYSIGQQNSYPVFHGRKLVLNYTDGSPCDLEDIKAVAGGGSSAEDLFAREKIDPKKPSDEDEDDDDEDDDDDDDDDDKSSRRKKPGSRIVRRKSTIISLLCDKDPLSPQLTLSFVASSPDACAYFFEARSAAACGGIETAKQTLSPSGVFGVIVLIAIIVYVVGGCVYSRVVLQQRGWRQLPNYALWSGIFGFFKDLFIILTSSCARFLPSSRRGYSRVNGSRNAGRGRGQGDSDAENRLIDELNEEWED